MHGLEVAAEVCDDGEVAGGRAGIVSGDRRRASTRISGAIAQIFTPPSRAQAAFGRPFSYQARRPHSPVLLRLTD
jgi:hypothetical protein